jgi:hypothetical protein
MHALICCYYYGAQFFCVLQTIIIKGTTQYKAYYEAKDKQGAGKENTCGTKKNCVLHACG